MTGRYIDEWIRTYELPPEGFDPMTAPAVLLSQYGLPRRPDPETEPALARLFKRAFARPRHFLKPELVADQALERLLAQRRARPEFTFGDWGGAVVTTSPDDPPDMVFAQIVVPRLVGIDPEITDDLIVGFWVGMGGYIGSNSLLQAGIGATVTPDPLFPGLGSASYWAWAEWWPTGYKVANLDVCAGDVVSVLVAAPKPNLGFVMLENLRTDQIVSVPLSPRGNATANGPAAGWIIEALSEDTPAFSPVTFFNCIAGSQHSTLDLTGGTALGMPGPTGNDVNATIVSPSLLTVGWEAR